MDLLEKIYNCESDEELDKIVKEALDECIKNSEEKEMLGFPYGSSNFLGVYKGFINPNTRIRFSSITVVSYSMKSMDFYYEFARFIKKMKIKDKNSLVSIIMTFINNYLGIPNGKDIRETYLWNITFQTTKTDEEAFEKINNLEISNFKNKNIGMCTERGAIAQNLLSLFGFESLYCIGCVKQDDIEEAHCFNIVRAANNYRLVDYSLLCDYYQNGKRTFFVPLIGDIALDKTEDFLFNNSEMKFDVYEYNKTSDGLKRKIVDNRSYIIGQTEFNKEKNK